MAAIFIDDNCFFDPAMTVHEDADQGVNAKSSKWIDEHPRSPLNTVRSIYWLSDKLQQTKQLCRDSKRSKIDHFHWLAMSKHHVFVGGVTTTIPAKSCRSSSYLTPYFSGGLLGPTIFNLTKRIVT